MTTDMNWRRDQDGLGVWPHRGKVAIVGWGMSPVDRRWDGVSMDKTLGAYSKLAAERALEDAGLKASDIDGLLMCPNNMAGAGSGSSASWGPSRPYFDAPYDSEDGLTIVTNNWLRKYWTELSGVQYAPDQVPDIGEGLGMAAEAVAQGKCDYALYIYTANNLEGRYRRGGASAQDHAAGPSQWNFPWGGNVIDLQLWTTIPLRQYLRKYGGEWDDLMAPIILNEHRNGMMTSWGYYTQNGESGLTKEEYADARPITWPAKIWDYDRPVNAAGAFIITSAERARDLKQKPIYILNHNEGGLQMGRSSHITMDEYETAMARVAARSYEGSGLKPADIDIFNPYDGFSPFLPFSLEAFGWHGVGKGDAMAFVNGDISVEGPHPLHSGGGNLGNGRTRTAMYIDGIEQLRGTAGKRQVNVKAETAICAYAPALAPWYLVLSNQPS